MPVDVANGLYLLQDEQEKPARTRKPGAAADEREDRGRILACARCRSPVTSTAARIAVGGAHEHRFLNPAGLVFHIGCFSEATGCFAVGEPTSEWSWFPPHSWQVEACATCGRHLGWLFQSSESAFHGFILDRLVELFGRDPRTAAGS